MKKQLLVFAMMLLTLSLFAVWNVGEPVLDDYSWTDDSGETHSIHELTAAGKVVVMFWGGTG